MAAAWSVGNPVIGTRTTDTRIGAGRPAGTVPGRRITPVARPATTAIAATRSSTPAPIARLITRSAVDGNRAGAGEASTGVVASSRRGSDGPPSKVMSAAGL